MKYPTFAEDLVREARQCGKEVLELDWLDEGSMAMEIAAYRPTFVFTINISDKIGSICRFLNIPYLTWTVDIPAYNFFAPRAIGAE